MLGVMPTKEALSKAKAKGLDLVEVSPKTKPPVCRIMDFGKYRYEESRKQRQARQQKRGNQIKEIKFHSNVGEHDYQTKIGHVRKFLEKGHKVKITLTFRGRENAHKDLGFDLVNRVLKDCEDICVVDSPPKLMGRAIIAILGARSGKSGK
jgi:translation initiation factor IF-3